MHMHMQMYIFLCVASLRADEELLLEELVREVDSGVHDAEAVRADGRGDVPDADGREVLDWEEWKGGMVERYWVREGGGRSGGRLGGRGGGR